MKKFFGLLLFYAFTMLLGWYTGTLLFAFFTWTAPVLEIPGLALRVGFLWVLGITGFMTWRGRNESNG
ncbi:hypothetical protein SPLA5a_PHROGS00073 [Salmonella phage SPLA5a]|nr:hypothetical protein SPLA5a_PHROGS00073 [Salmonella phage SPLA5a]